jgi:hypothetical protein
VITIMTAPVYQYLKANTEQKWSLDGTTRAMGCLCQWKSMESGEGTILGNPQLITFLLHTTHHIWVNWQEILVVMNYSWVILKHLHLYRRTVLQAFKSQTQFLKKDGISLQIEIIRADEWGNCLWIINNNCYIY